MRKKNFIVIALSISLIIGLISGWIFLISMLAKPLGPSLKEDLTGQPTPDFKQARTPEQTSLPLPTQQPSPPQTPLPTQQPSPTQEPLQTQKPPLCGDTPVLTILLSGIDYRGDNYLYGLADVIRVVRIDFTIPKVTIFTLDRDIWVEIPEIQKHYGITHGKLNQAYFYGVPAMGYYTGSAGGAGLLAKTLYLNFGLKVDNYAVVSMAAFVRGVDALGGIDVDVPEPIAGGSKGLNSFKAGLQHLNGTRALALARVRYGYSSLIRITNQDAIIKGLTDKLSSPDILLKIPALLQAFRGTVLTDLSPNQINSMVCLLSKMRLKDIYFAEIPTSYYVQSNIYDPNMHMNTFIWDIDFKVIRQYVNEFQSGRWP